MQQYAYCSELNFNLLILKILILHKLLHVSKSKIYCGDLNHVATNTIAL